MGVIACRDCQRHRRHIEMLRDRIGELELRLEGALQRERRAAATSAKDSDQKGRIQSPDTEYVQSGALLVPVALRQHQQD
jgi:hypothetical protein